MSVKILAVNGSPRKGGTEYALQYALQAAEEIGGVKTELVNLRGEEINFCVHCNRCIKEKVLHCPAFDDYMNELYPKILEADGLIIGSPVYMTAPSAQTVAFLNRFRPLGRLIARGEFGTKVAGGVAVGGSRNGGQDLTLGIIGSMASACGYTVVTGGVYAYNGGSIWSGGNDGEKMEAAANDDVGLKTVQIIGRKVAAIATLLKEGAAHANLPQCQQAGFLNEEEIMERTSSFKRG